LPDEESPMHERLTLPAVVLALCCAAVWPTRAAAWGKKGHEIAGRIVDKHLD
jgi:hypothetical protein